MNETTPTSLDPHRQYRPDPAFVRKLIAKRSFATIASTSDAGWPHVAAIIYEFVDDTLYFHTMRTSRKGRNIGTNDKVAVVIPVRRLPVGPASIIQFQTTARLVEPSSDEIANHISQGKLGSITGHGELDEPLGCFVAVKLPKRVLTHGIGMSLPKLIKAPLLAGGLVEFG